MRKWRIVDPDVDGNPVVTIVYEDDLRHTFWPWWKNKMQELGREDQISYEECIDDWVVGQWAEEIT